jgi:hypothetical protein
LVSLTEEGAQRGYSDYLFLGGQQGQHQHANNRGVNVS